MLIKANFNILLLFIVVFRTTFACSPLIIFELIKNTFSVLRLLIHLLVHIHYHLCSYVFYSIMYIEHGLTNYYQLHLLIKYNCNKLTIVKFI